MRLLAIIMLLLAGTVAYATTTQVTACGSYSTSDNNDVNITTNIYANVGSTITVGTCIYISPSGVGTVMWNNFTIYQNGSSATTGVTLHSDAVSDQTVTSFVGNLQITGFTNGIDYQEFYSQGGYAFDVTYQQMSVYTRNVSNPIIITGKYSANSADVWKVNTRLYTCSAVVPYTFTTLGTGGDWNLTISPIVGECSNINLLTNMYSTSSGYHIFQSNKLFYWNYAGTNVSSTMSIWNVGPFTQSGVVFAPNTTFSTTTTSGNWYINATVSNDATKSYSNTYTSASMVGKIYYCVAGLCNPLYFKTSPTFPVYINVPDFTQIIKFQQNYTNITIYWKQGVVNYEVASSINNQDTEFMLQQNGVFLVVVDGTNYTFVNTCPSAYTACELVPFTSNSSTTYTTIPFVNYNDIYRFVTWSIYPTTSTNWITNDTTYTLTFSNTMGNFEYFGITVMKYNNFTTTIYFNQTDNTSGTGGIMNFTTNGSGRYDVVPFYKILTVTARTNGLVQSIWQGNNTGLMGVGISLSSGTIITPWVYGVLALLASAVVVILLSGYTYTGAGLVGCMVFWGFSLVWNAPLLPIAGLATMTMTHLASLTSIITVAWMLRGS